MLELLSKGVMAMTGAKIYVNTLGHRSEYVKGFGLGPKQSFSFKSRQTSFQHEVESENWLSEIQLRMESQQKQLDT